MKAFSIPAMGVFSALAFITSTIASPHGGRPMNRRQDGDYFVIRGVTGTGVQPRLEIRNLEKQTEQWNLFILAMDRFQNMNQNDKLSFYKIAGIHGAPYISWDGVEGSGDLGYCPHYSNLFGTWHRPYLSMIEQLLHEHAVSIAAEFPSGSTGTKYRDAAAKLRLPYWDWAQKPASGQPTVPKSISAVTTTVKYPNGTQASILNPLYSYRFHPLNGNVFPNDPFNVWPETMRWPTKNSRGATPRPAKVEEYMKREYTNLRSNMYNLLSNYQPYYSFTSVESEAGFGSLESTHGTVHSLVGGGTGVDGTADVMGHMTPVPYAAFDPIFFLHHSNVDRYIALFQYLYPDTFVEPEINDATYTIPKDSIQDADSPLTPFHIDSDGQFFTSNMVRNWEDGGYTYPELAGKPSNASVRASINALYGNGNFLRRRDSGNSDQTLSRVYLVRIRIPITSVQNTVSVSVDGLYAGSHSTLARPDPRGRKLLNTASIDLTSVLSQKLKEGKLSGLSQEVVVKFLKASLTWELAKQDKPDGLVVELISTAVEPPASADDFPRWVGGFVEHLKF